MTTTIAVTGKSGSGKTTFVKTITKILHETYPDKSILLIDNDLSCELGLLFNIEIKSTLSDINVKKYRYKTKLPDQITRHEFIEWALQDILVKVYDDIDLIPTGHSSSRECNCFIAALIRDALGRLIKEYDIAIFDCEFDLEYLQYMVNCPMDVTLIMSEPSITSVNSAARVKKTSQEYASPGQIGLVLNKTKNRKIPDDISALFIEYDLNIIGTLPYDEKLETKETYEDSEMLHEAIKELLFRLNLPY